MRCIIGILALLATWAGLFLLLTILTELSFAPWDTAVVRPEVGTWQHTLNSFFEKSPGNMVFATIGVGASLLLALVSLRRNPNAALRLAAVNGLVLALLLPLFMLAAFVNNLVFPYPAGVLYDPTFPGYHRSVIPGGAMLIACAVWLLWQRQIARRHAADGLPA